MRSRWLPALSILTPLFAFALSARAQTSVFIGGDVKNPGDWTAQHMEEVFAADLKPVVITSKGDKRTFNCIPLLSLLKAAGVPTELNMDPKADPRQKNFALRFVIVAEGRDGYTAAFSLGELLSDIGDRQAWLALDVDGKPLSDKEGPVRLLVPQDQMPARGVHELREITVVDESGAATRPAN